MTGFDLSCTAAAVLVNGSVLQREVKQEEKKAAFFVHVFLRSHYSGIVLMTYAGLLLQCIISKYEIISRDPARE